eukprot:657023-Alexandrium_andersonii.AAC.1
MSAKGTKGDAHPAAPAGSSEDAPGEPGDSGGEAPGEGGQGDAPPEAPPAQVPELSRAQKRDLRAEARSARHLLTHRPKNPYSHAGTVVKLTRPPRYKGSYVNEASRVWSHRT